MDCILIFQLTLLLFVIGSCFSVHILSFIIQRIPELPKYGFRALNICHLYTTDNLRYMLYFHVLGRKMAEKVMKKLAAFCNKTVLCYQCVE